MGWAEELKDTYVRVKRVLTYDRDGTPATHGPEERVFVRRTSNVARSNQLGLIGAKGDFLSSDDRVWSVDDRVWIEGEDTVDVSPKYGRRVLAAGADGASGYYTYWCAL